MTFPLLRVDIPDPMLLPQREASFVLQAVYELMNSELRDQIVLDWGDSHLVVKLNIEFDTLEPYFHDAPFRRTRGYRKQGPGSFWQKFVGKECHWTWVGVCRQGYSDIIILSFDYTRPQVLLYGDCSSIEVLRISEASKGISTKRGKKTQKATKA